MGWGGGEQKDGGSSFLALFLSPLPSPSGAGLENSSSLFLNPWLVSQD